jgi:hypothetical protein
MAKGGRGGSWCTREPAEPTALRELISTKAYGKCNSLICKGKHRRGPQLASRGLARDGRMCSPSVPRTAPKPPLPTSASAPATAKSPEDVTSSYVTEVKPKIEAEAARTAAEEGA